MVDLPRYSIILADPPWQYDNDYDDNPKNGGMTYPTMRVDEIANLPIARLAHDESALFMWATMPKLREAMYVMESWGFPYITTTFVWIKLNPLGSLLQISKDVLLKRGFYSGMGHWTNGNVELVLFGKRGRPQRVSKSVKQIMVAPRGRHSAKPPEVHERIKNLMGDLPALEIFARDPYPGWNTRGNELDGESLQDWLAQYPLSKDELRPKKSRGQYPITLFLPLRRT